MSFKLSSSHYNTLVISLIVGAFAFVVVINLRSGLVGNPITYLASAVSSSNCSTVLQVAEKEGQKIELITLKNSLAQELKDIEQQKGTIEAGLKIASTSLQTLKRSVTDTTGLALERKLDDLIKKQADMLAKPVKTATDLATLKKLENIDIPGARKSQYEFIKKTNEYNTGVASYHATYAPQLDTLQTINARILLLKGNLKTKTKGLIQQNLEALSQIEKDLKARKPCTESTRVTSGVTANTFLSAVCYTPEQLAGFETQKAFYDIDQLTVPKELENLEKFIKTGPILLASTTKYLEVNKKLFATPEQLSTAEKLVATTTKQFNDSLKSVRTNASVTISKGFEAKKNSAIKDYNAKLSFNANYTKLKTLETDLKRRIQSAPADMLTLQNKLANLEVNAPLIATKITEVRGKICSTVNTGQSVTSTVDARATTNTGLNASQNPGSITTEPIVCTIDRSTLTDKDLEYLAYISGFISELDIMDFAPSQTLQRRLSAGVSDDESNSTLNDTVHFTDALNQKLISIINEDANTMKLKIVDAINDQDNQRKNPSNCVTEPVVENHPVRNYLHDVANVTLRVSEPTAFQNTIFNIVVNGIRVVDIKLGNEIRLYAIVNFGQGYTFTRLGCLQFPVSPALYHLGHIDDLAADLCNEMEV